MKIACRWFCAALAGFVISGTAHAQVAPYPEPPDLGSPDYTITVQDDAKAPKKGPEKIGSPKAGPEGAKTADEGPAAEPKGNGCCAESKSNGCCHESNGCCHKKKKNGKKKNGCCEKNGCGDKKDDEKKDENGCADKKDEEEEEDECCNYCYLFGPKKAVSFWDEMWDHCDDDAKPCIKVSGWLEAGYNSRQEPLSQSYGDLLSFNDVPHHFHMHQAYLIVEKALDTEKCCWDWGFKVDTVYGTDAQKTQAFGNPPPNGAEGWDNGWDNGVYGWAIPQAYGVIGNKDLTVKIGHMYTYMGYEVIPATGNFFFSHSLTTFNTEPFTHTGVMSEYKVNKDLTVDAGWMLGWDTGFDRFEDGSIFHGGFSYQITKDVKFQYMTCIGDFGRRGKDGYLQTVLFDTKLTEKWQWVVQSDVLRIDEAPDGTQLGDDATSVINYLFYNHSDCWKFGCRFEWWKGNLPVPPYASPDFGSHYDFTYGLNYKPHANVVIRPEVRHDWSPATNIRSNEFAVDAIFTF